MSKSCADAPPHKHEVIVGTAAVKHTARYADSFTTTYADCLRLSWKSGFKPAKMDYLEKPVESFQSLLYVPEKVERAGAVHIRASSASSTGTPEGGARVPRGAAASASAAAPEVAQNGLPGMGLAALLQAAAQLVQHRSRRGLDQRTPTRRRV